MLFRIYHKFPTRCLRELSPLRRCMSNESIERNRVVFSGIQPTGIPHLGNYLGAIKQWVEMQKEPGEIYFSIVDLHALTIEHDMKIINKGLDMTACLLACGIDPARSALFKQSDICEHTMLFWALNCIVMQKKLAQMIQWKDKSKLKEGAGNLGLFSYPILQCADILLYKATHVPVGDDQTQHVELCREIARKFNNRYGDYFPEPALLIDPGCTKIKSLRDPFVKMSKSTGVDFSRINLNDSDDAIWNKIKRAVTDNKSEITFDPIRRQGVSNLIQIHSSLTGMPVPEICLKAQNEKLDTGQYKMAVAEAVIDHIKPIREKYEDLADNKDYLETVLKDGAAKAKETTSKNWNDIKKLLGLS